MRWLVSLPFLLSLTACGGEPIVGRWQSDQVVGNGLRNEMTIRAQKDGRAVIYAARASQQEDPNAYVGFTFDVAWAAEDDLYQLNFTCRLGECDGTNNFRMECYAFEEDDGSVKLECTGSDRFTSYPFGWELVE